MYTSIDTNHVIYRTSPRWLPHRRRQGGRHAQQSLQVGRLLLPLAPWDGNGYLRVLYLCDNIHCLGNAKAPPDLRPPPPPSRRACSCFFTFDSAMIFSISGWTLEAPTLGSSSKTTPRHLESSSGIRRAVFVHHLSRSHHFDREWQDRHADVPKGNTHPLPVHPTCFFCLLSGHDEGVICDLIRNYYLQNSKESNYMDMAVKLFERHVAREWNRAEMKRFILSANAKLHMQPLTVAAPEPLSIKERLFVHL
ncbi:hypothetical protein ACHAWF_006298, partial [Thalassiosira exigua]